MGDTGMAPPRTIIPSFSYGGRFPACGVAAQDAPPDDNSCHGEPKDRFICHNAPLPNPQGFQRNVLTHGSSGAAVRSGKSFGRRDEPPPLSWASVLVTIPGLALARALTRLIRTDGEKREYRTDLMLSGSWIRINFTVDGQDNILSASANAVGMGNGGGGNGHGNGASPSEKRVAVSSPDPTRPRQIGLELEPGKPPLQLSYGAQVGRVSSKPELLEHQSSVPPTLSSALEALPKAPPPVLIAEPQLIANVGGTWSGEQGKLQTWELVFSNGDVVSLRFWVSHHSTSFSIDRQNSFLSRVVEGEPTKIGLRIEETSSSVTARGGGWTVTLPTVAPSATKSLLTFPGEGRRVQFDPRVVAVSAAAPGGQGAGGAKPLSWKVELLPTEETIRALNGPPLDTAFQLRFTGTVAGYPIGSHAPFVVEGRFDFDGKFIPALPPGESREVTLIPADYTGVITVAMSNEGGTLVLRPSSEWASGEQAPAVAMLSLGRAVAFGTDPALTAQSLVGLFRMGEVAPIEPSKIPPPSAWQPAHQGVVGELARFFSKRIPIHQTGVVETAPEEGEPESLLVKVNIHGDQALLLRRKAGEGSVAYEVLNRSPDGSEVSVLTLGAGESRTIEGLLWSKAGKQVMAQPWRERLLPAGGGASEGECTSGVGHVRASLRGAGHPSLTFEMPQEVPFEARHVGFVRMNGPSHFFVDMADGETLRVSSEGMALPDALLALAYEPLPGEGSAFRVERYAPTGELLAEGEIRRGLGEWVLSSQGEGALPQESAFFLDIGRGEVLAHLLPSRREAVPSGPPPVEERAVCAPPEPVVLPPAISARPISPPSPPAFPWREGAYLLPDREARHQMRMASSGDVREGTRRRFTFYGDRYGGETRAVSIRAEMAARGERATNFFGLIVEMDMVLMGGAWRPSADGVMKVESRFPEYDEGGRVVGNGRRSRFCGEFPIRPTQTGNGWGVKVAQDSLLTPFHARDAEGRAFVDYGFSFGPPQEEAIRRFGEVERHLDRLSQGGVPRLGAPPPARPVPVWAQVDHGRQSFVMPQFGDPLYRGQIPLEARSAFVELSPGYVEPLPQERFTQLRFHDQNGVNFRVIFQHHGKETSVRWFEVGGQPQDLRQINIETAGRSSRLSGVARISPSLAIPFEVAWTQREGVFVLDDLTLGERTLALMEGRGLAFDPSAWPTERIREKRAGTSVLVKLSPARGRDRAPRRKLPPVHREHTIITPETGLDELISGLREGKAIDAINAAYRIFSAEDPQDVRTIELSLRYDDKTGRYEPVAENGFATVRLVGEEGSFLAGVRERGRSVVMESPEGKFFLVGAYVRTEATPVPNRPLPVLVVSDGGDPASAADAFLLERGLAPRAERVSFQPDANGHFDVGISVRGRRYTVPMRIVSPPVGQHSFVVPRGAARGEGDGRAARLDYYPPDRGAAILRIEGVAMSVRMVWEGALEFKPTFPGLTPSGAARLQNHVVFENGTASAPVLVDLNEDDFASKVKGVGQAAGSHRIVGREMTDVVTGRRYTFFFSVVEDPFGKVGLAFKGLAIAGPGEKVRVVESRTIERMGRVSVATSAGQYFSLDPQVTSRLEVVSHGLIAPPELPAKGWTTLAPAEALLFAEVERPRGPCPPRPAAESPAPPVQNVVTPPPADAAPPEDVRRTLSRMVVQECLPALFKNGRLKDGNLRGEVDAMVEAVGQSLFGGTPEEAAADLVKPGHHFKGPALKQARETLIQRAEALQRSRAGNRQLADDLGRNVQSFRGGDHFKGKVEKAQDDLRGRLTPSAPEPSGFVVFRDFAEMDDIAVSEAELARFAEWNRNAWEHGVRYHGLKGSELDFHRGVLYKLKARAQMLGIGSPGELAAWLKGKSVPVAPCEFDLDIAAPLQVADERYMRLLGEWCGYAGEGSVSFAPVTSGPRRFTVAEELARLRDHVARVRAGIPSRDRAGDRAGIREWIRWFRDTAGKLGITDLNSLERWLATNKPAGAVTAGQHPDYVAMMQLKEVETEMATRLEEERRGRSGAPEAPSPEGSKPSPSPASPPAPVEPRAPSSEPPSPSPAPLPAGAPSPSSPRPPAPPAPEAALPSPEPFPAEASASSPPPQPPPPPPAGGPPPSGDLPDGGGKGSDEALKREVARRIVHSCLPALYQKTPESGDHSLKPEYANHREAIEGFVDIFTRGESLDMQRAMDYMRRYGQLPPFNADAAQREFYKAFAKWRGKVGDPAFSQSLWIDGWAEHAQDKAKFTKHVRRAYAFALGEITGGGRAPVCEAPAQASPPRGGSGGVSAPGGILFPELRPHAASRTGLRQYGPSSFYSGVLDYIREDGTVVREGPEGRANLELGSAAEEQFRMERGGEVEDSLPPEVPLPLEGEALRSPGRAADSSPERGSPSGYFYDSPSNRSSARTEVARAFGVEEALLWNMGSRYPRGVGFAQSKGADLSAGAAGDLKRRVLSRKGSPLEVSCRLDEDLRVPEGGTISVIYRTGAQTLNIPHSSFEFGKRRYLALRGPLSGVVFYWNSIRGGGVVLTELTHPALREELERRLGGPNVTSRNRAVRYPIPEGEMDAALQRQLARVEMTTPFSSPPEACAQPQGAAPAPAAQAQRRYADASPAERDVIRRHISDVGMARMTAAVVAEYLGLTDPALRPPEALCTWIEPVVDPQGNPSADLRASLRTVRKYVGPWIRGELAKTPENAALQAAARILSKEGETRFSDAVNKVLMGRLAQVARTRSIQGGAVALPFDPEALRAKVQHGISKVARATEATTQVLGSGAAKVGIGAIPFAFGEYVSNIFTGHRNPNLPELLRNYGALSLGGGIGQMATDGVINAMAGKGFFETVNIPVGRGFTLKNLSRRAVPLFAAVLFADIASGRAVDAKGVALAVGNIAAVTSVVHFAGGLATRVSWLRRFAVASKIARTGALLAAPLSGGRSLVALAKTSAEFILLKYLAEGEEMFFTYMKEREIKDSYAKAVAKSNAILEKAGRGQMGETPARELLEAQFELTVAHAALVEFYEARIQRLKEERELALRELREERLAAVTAKDRGGFSIREINEGFDEERQKVFDAYGEKIAGIAGDDTGGGAFQPIPHSPEHPQIKKSLATAETLRAITAQHEAYVKGLDVFWKEGALQLAERQRFCSDISL